MQLVSLCHPRILRGGLWESLCPSGIGLSVYSVLSLWWYVGYFVQFVTFINLHLLNIIWEKYIGVTLLVEFVRIKCFRLMWSELFPHFLCNYKKNHTKSCKPWKCFCLLYPHHKMWGGAYTGFALSRQSVFRSVGRSVSNSCPLYNSFTNGRISIKLEWHIHLN